MTKDDIYLFNTTQIYMRLLYIGDVLHFTMDEISFEKVEIVEQWHVECHLEGLE